jgi:hypothetical protein
MLDSKDQPHASSHWKEFGALETGFWTQRRADPADWIGSPLLALTSPDRLRVLRSFPVAVRTSHQMGLAFTQDTVRQLCTVVLLRPHLATASAALVIGDGFGVVAGLIRAIFPRVSLHLVDLSFTLREQQTRLVRAFGANGLEFAHAADLNQWADRRFDVAINVASMQEMDPPEVARYFTFMRGRVRLFYCCNRERKVLPDGTVSAFQNYPWSADDEILLDEPCPWHQFFFSVRPPFVRHYDGMHRHRLARLVRASS